MYYSVIISFHDFLKMKAGV